MRILFITSTRIGDAVLGSGVLAHLVERHPRARFTIACGPLAAPLFVGVPRVERIIEVVKKSRKRHWWDLWRAVAGRRWDLVVDLRGSALAWLLRTRQRRLLPPFDDGAHRVVHYSRAMGTGEIFAPRIFTTSEAEARACEILSEARRWLLLGPTSNSIGKQWPALNFAELTHRLTQAGGPMDGAPVLVLGGPGEEARAAPLVKRLSRTGCSTLFGSEDLLTVSACLARARLYVGNDSGLMHLAAASGVPTLGLFGPSDERIYGPWGPHAAAVRGDPLPEDFEKRLDGPARIALMHSLPVDAVEGAALRLLAAQVPAMACNGN